MTTSMPFRQIRGQSITETLLLLPLYLALVFGMLQAAYIGLALATTSHAAGSIARRAAREDTVKSFPEDRYKDRLDAVLFAGMKPYAVKASVPDHPTLPVVTVNACAEIMAFPLVGTFFNALFKDAYDGGGDICAPGNKKSMGPIYFVPKPAYHFVIEGSAEVRFNIQK
jgi:hypothetical protein